MRSHRQLLGSPALGLTEMWSRLQVAFRALQGSTQCRFCPPSETLDNVRQHRQHLFDECMHRQNRCLQVTSSSW